MKVFELSLPKSFANTVQPRAQPSQLSSNSSTEVSNLHMLSCALTPTNTITKAPSDSEDRAQ